MMRETAEQPIANRLTQLAFLGSFSATSFRFYGMFLLAGSAFILLPCVAVSHSPDDPLIADWGMISSANPQNWFAQWVALFCHQKLFQVRLGLALGYWMMVLVIEPLDGPVKVGFYGLCLNIVVIIGMIVGCSLWV